MILLSSEIVKFYNLSLTYFVCECVPVPVTRATAHTRKAEETLRELVFFFHCLSDNCLDPLSHLAICILKVFLKYEFGFALHFSILSPIAQIFKSL